MTTNGEDHKITTGFRQSFALYIFIWLSIAFYMHAYNLSTDSLVLSTQIGSITLTILRDWETSLPREFKCNPKDL